MQTLPSQQHAARTSLPISQDWLSRHATRSDALRCYTPASWQYVANRPREVHERYAPTMLQLEETFGDGFGAAMINLQLTSLFGTSASTDPTIGQAIGLFAPDFAASLMGEKSTVVMLFFARYRAGRYDSSFTRFDLRRIGNAYWSEFLPDWRREIGKYEEEREAAARAERYAARASEAISREAYDRLPNIRIYLNAKADERTLKRIKDHFHLCGISVNGECSKRCTEQDLAELRECEKRGFLKIREIQELPKC